MFHPGIYNGLCNFNCVSALECKEEENSYQPVQIRGGSCDAACGCVVDLPPVQRHTYMNASWIGDSCTY